MTSTNKTSITAKQCLKFSAPVALAICIGLTPFSYAEQQVAISVAKTADAQIFAEFTDKYPAVLNYFSKASEQEIISFYQQQYGDVIEQERKRGRLTMHFIKDEEKVRVVISQQNKKRQVDILIEK